MLEKTAMPPTVSNRLLQRLPMEDTNSILDHCELVELTFGTLLHEADKPIAEVYFPLTGLISLVKAVDRHEPLETEIIGNEGMLGVTLVLGIDNAPQRALVQGPGSALRMPAAQFIRTVSESQALLDTLNHYIYILIVQLSQTAVCSRFHDVGARLARWLLMVHDRSHSNDFHLTHQHLADMLGVQRGAVTIAAGLLQQKNIIRYSRGQITVIDRKGLETASCECYQAELDIYTRLHF